MKEASQMDTLPYEAHKVENSMKLTINTFNQVVKNIPVEIKQPTLIIEEPEDVINTNKPFEGRKQSDDTTESLEKQDEEAKGGNIRKLSSLCI
jgi:hypothetical protein